MAGFAVGARLPYSKAMRFEGEVEVEFGKLPNVVVSGWVVVLEKGIMPPGPDAIAIWAAIRDASAEFAYPTAGTTPVE